VVSEASGVPLCALRTHLRAMSLPPQALFLEALGKEVGGSAAEAPGGHAARGGGAGEQRARNTRASARVMTRVMTVDGGARGVGGAGAEGPSSALHARASVLAAATRRTAHMRKKRSEVVRAEDAEDVGRREAHAANLGRFFSF